MTADQLRVIWLLRLLLGTLFLLGSEVLLWIDPPGRSLPEWAVLVVGYMALGTLALDLLARYRARSVYEAMAVIAIVALLNGLLLNPTTSYVDFPRTLATRVLGAHGLLTLEMFGLFLVLTAGHIRYYLRLLLISGVWLGFFLGVWVRWAAVLIDWPPGELVPLPPVLVGVVVGVAVIAILLTLLARQKAAISLPDLRLSRTQWYVLVAVLAALFLLQAFSGGITLAAVLATAAIIALAVTILWFQRADTGRTVLDANMPPRPLPLLWLGLAFIITAGMTYVAYELPLLDILGYNQLSFMEFGFALVGFGWFPLLAAVIGGSAMERRLRTEQI
ncbi:MAG: hypothetical protein OHK0046_13570 [Anaerolineae bacterium]